MSDKEKSWFDLFCNECGRHHIIVGLNEQFCPDCGHVNIGFTPLHIGIDLSLAQQSGEIQRKQIEEVGKLLVDGFTTGLDKEIKQYLLMDRETAKSLYDSAIKQHYLKKEK